MRPKKILNGHSIKRRVNIPKPELRIERPNNKTFTDIDFKYGINEIAFKRLSFDDDNITIVYLNKDKRWKIEKDLEECCSKKEIQKDFERDYKCTRYYYEHIKYDFITLSSNYNKYYELKKSQPCCTIFTRCSKCDRRNRWPRAKFKKGIQLDIKFG